MSKPSTTPTLESPSSFVSTPFREPAYTARSSPLADSASLSTASSASARLADDSQTLRPLGTPFKRWPTVHEHTYQARGPQGYEGVSWKDAPEKSPVDADLSIAPDASPRASSIAPMARRSTTVASFGLSRSGTGRSSVSSMARGIVKGIPDFRMFEEANETDKPRPQRKRTFSIFSASKKSPESTNSKTQTISKSAKGKIEATAPSKNSLQDRRNPKKRGKELKMRMPSQLLDLPPRSRSPVSSKNFVGAVRRPRSPKTPFVGAEEQASYITPHFTPIQEPFKIVTPNEGLVKTPKTSKSLTDPSLKEPPSKTRGPVHFWPTSDQSSETSTKDHLATPQNISSPKKRPLRRWLPQTPSGDDFEQHTDIFTGNGDNDAAAHSKARGTGPRASMGGFNRYPSSMASPNNITPTPPSTPCQPGIQKRFSMSSALVKTPHPSTSGSATSPQTGSVPTRRRLFARSSDRSEKSAKTPPLVSPLRLAFATPPAVLTPPAAPTSVKFTTGDLFYDTQRKALARPKGQDGGLWDSDAVLMSQTPLADAISNSSAESPNEGPFDRVGAAIPNTPADTGTWFRVQTLEEEENDSGEYGSVEPGVLITRAEFDWIVPDHLPNSILCPIHPSHKSGGRGICVYHGRNKRHKSEADYEIGHLGGGKPQFC